MERDVDVLAGEQRRWSGGCTSRRVEQERGVEAVEEAVLDHDRLARAALLGRRAQEHDLAGQLGAIAARAIAAPTPEAAIVLWPQPWPRPGSASYSARMPIRGPVARRARPAGHRAQAPRTAVARLPGRMLDRIAVGAQRHRRSRSRPGPPRRPAPGWRGSGGSGRGSRPGAPRPRPPRAPWQRGGRPSGPRSAPDQRPDRSAGSPVDREGRLGDPDDHQHEQGDRQAERILEPEQRRTGRPRTRPTPPRRKARSQSPR